jgi:hypothetical protein
MAQEQRVEGAATVGDKVTYHDMANQDGTIWEVISTPEQNEDPKWGWTKGYGLMTTDDAGETQWAYSDLAQHGWTFAN